MKLWSLHDPSFSLTDGTVIHSKSDYYTTVNRVKDAYHKLWTKIGQADGQVIWCYTTFDHVPRTGIPKLLWCLDVPDDRILCCVDDIAWNRIIGQNQVALPRHLQHEWDRQPKMGDWWSELLLANNMPGPLRTALIRHPVPEQFVTERLEWHVDSPRRGSS
jgi:hypothetical protein